MSSAIQNILERTLGDMARSAKYEVFFSFTDQKVTLPVNDLIAMGKTASFPGKQHTTIDLKYKGRSIPIKGQTKYTQTWECSFHLTEDHSLKVAFENWIEALDQKHNYLDVTVSPNIPGLQRRNSTDGYTTPLYIYQKNFYDDEATAEYVLENAFPIEVSPVQTSYESVGTVQEFTVTFAYSHYTSRVLKGSSGNFIDDIIGKAEASTRAAITSGISVVGNAANNFVSGLFSAEPTSAQIQTSDDRASQTMGAGYNTMKTSIQKEIEAKGK